MTSFKTNRVISTFFVRPIVLFRHFRKTNRIISTISVKPIVLFRQFPRNQSCYFDNFRVSMKHIRWEYEHFRWVSVMLIVIPWHRTS